MPENSNTPPLQACIGVRRSLVFMHGRRASPSISLVGYGLALRRLLRCSEFALLGPRQERKGSERASGLIWTQDHLSRRHPGSHLHAMVDPAVHMELLVVLHVPLAA
eukprot:10049766-Alexandrium_andersonii.AAC.1